MLKKLQDMMFAAILLFGTAVLVFQPTESVAQVFRDVASDAGLELILNPDPGKSGINGVAAADYNNDGYTDLYLVVREAFVINDLRTWNRLYVNNGNGTFSDVTQQAGLGGKQSLPDSSIYPGHMGYKIGASWGDFNNDGYPDLFLTHAGPDRLFQNNGDGTFTDITQKAGVAGRATQFSSSAVWFDLQNDGLLDLYISVREDYYSGTRNQANRVYKNNGDGTFADISASSGAADSGLTYTSLPIDVNNDGHLDLYLANDFGRNKLYVNNGDETFTEQTGTYNLEDPYEGMGLATADVDGNGYFDIYVTNRSEGRSKNQLNPLFLNNGDQSFTDIGGPAGVALADWGWGTIFLDYDNDGREDLFVGNGYLTVDYANYFWRNITEEEVRFENITKQAGLYDSMQVRGVAVFDYKQDGNPDLLVSNFNGQPKLYQNMAEAGNWLQVSLEGTTSNRDAIGAIVTVVANGRSYKKYQHGAQYYGQNLVPLHFGLDEATSVDSLHIEWPGGSREAIGRVEINQRIRVKESEGIVTANERASSSRTTQPGEITLRGNYPNPFNGATTIRFEMGRPGIAHLEIINTLGQTVYTHQQRIQEAGIHDFRWQISGGLSTGLYFYRVSTGHASTPLGKLIYLK